MTVTYTVVPNIGTVVNQGQGFRIKATITNDHLFALNDVKLKAISVPANFTPTAEGVRIPTIPAGGSVTVSMGFDTDASVAVGNHNIDMKCEAYVIGHEWTVIVSPPTTTHPIGVKDLYPKDTDNQTVVVNIMPE